MQTASIASGVACASAWRSLLAGTQLHELCGHAVQCLPSHSVMCVMRIPTVSTYPHAHRTWRSSTVYMHDHRTQLSSTTCMLQMPTTSQYCLQAPQRGSPHAYGREGTGHLLVCAL